jgi:beta-glucosidase-like glycosyl hydrolase
MTAHIVYEAVDPDAPATLSPTAIRLIREALGFGGLLMTDDLSMGALPGSIAARARGAIDAGCDLILHCNGKRGRWRMCWRRPARSMPMRWPVARRVGPARRGGAA